VVKLLNLLLSHPSSDLCTAQDQRTHVHTNSFHLPTKFLQPANLTTTDYLYTILSLFSLHVEPAPHLLSLVTLAQPSVSSSLQMQPLFHASPYLWNHLPSSFRQPSSVHCPPGSPHPAHHLITVTTFTPRLKTHLFHQSFYFIVTLIPSGLHRSCTCILTCTALASVFLVSSSFIYFLWLRVLDKAEYSALCALILFRDFGAI